MADLERMVQQFGLGAFRIEKSERVWLFDLPAGALHMLDLVVEKDRVQAGKKTQPPCWFSPSLPRSPFLDLWRNCLSLNYRRLSLRPVEF